MCACTCLIGPFIALPNDIRLHFVEKRIPGQFSREPCVHPHCVNRGACEWGGCIFVSKVVRYLSLLPILMGKPTWTCQYRYNSPMASALIYTLRCVQKHFTASSETLVTYKEYSDYTIRNHSSRDKPDSSKWWRWNPWLCHISTSNHIPST